MAEQAEHKDKGLWKDLVRNCIPDQCNRTCFEQLQESGDCTRIYQGAMATIGDRLASIVRLISGPSLSELG